MRLRQARKIASQWPVNANLRWNKAWIRIRKAARCHNERALADSTKAVVEYLSTPPTKAEIEMYEAIAEEAIAEITQLDTSEIG